MKRPSESAPAALLPPEAQLSGRLESNPPVLVSALGWRPPRVNEGRYQQMVETTCEGIWMADLQGITTFANSRMADMLATNPEQMTGRSVFDFVFLQDHAKVRQHFALILRAARGLSVEERLRRRDGEEIWAWVAAGVIRDDCSAPAVFLGLFRETTARHRAESALHQACERLAERVRQRTAALAATDHALMETEERFRHLFETISDALLVFDARTGRLVEVNEAALRLYGYSRRSFLRLTYCALTVEREASTAAIKQLLAGGPGCVPLRYHRRSDGTVFPVEISGSTFTLKGRPTICGVVRDITERRRAEEAIRRNLELERQILAVSEQEQRRLGQDLHDDLCQQLAGIEFLSQRLAADLAEDRPRLAPRAREIARLAQGAMSQTREMARGLSPVGLEADGLADGLQELAARTRKVFRVACHFEDLAALLVRNHGAAIHLYRIAQEAVTNAIRHGGARMIEISLRAQGDDTVLTVRDNGAGFPGKVPGRKGLGLALMRYRAEVMGGSVRIVPRRAGGTEVRCTVATAVLVSGQEGPQ